MAGESPDRSKQRESSAEPTSGSAGPVPGARNSAEERDPRSAVAREASPPKDRGNGDTATRVLSVREVTEDAPAADDASAEGRGDSAAKDAGRLREAASVWVRPAEPGEGTDGAAESGDGTGGASADGGTDTDGDGSGAGARTGTETGSGAGDASERVTAPAGGPKTEVEAEAEGADKAKGADKGADRDPDADEGGAGSGKAVREAPEAGPAPDAAGGAEDAADETPAGTPADASRDEDGDGSEGEDGDEPRGGGTPTADDADDAPEAGSPEGDDAAPDAGPPAGPSKAAPAGRTADGGSASDDDADDTADPSAGSEEAGAETAPEAGGPKADDDAPADTESDSETESETGSRTKAKGPVDQPTAVFRTRRPSAPPVDQPTTLLKLGDAGAKAAPGGESGTKPESKPESESGSKPGTKPRPESEPERTSKFVALKEFDDPGTRKPPRGGDATTAPRTVTPAAKSPAPADATSSVPQVGPELTTQQPVPPRPPLDLLAELTNTPPPPETPLRTAVRRVKIWTPLVLLLVIVFAVVQNVRPLPAPTLELTARDGYTFEGDKVDIPWPASGQAALDVQGIGTFGSSGEQKPVPIASVAKVMTAYLILRDHPLKSGAEGPMIKIDGTAEKQSDAGQESTVPVTAGDEISQREAVEAVLIASANNVARLLARWDAGSEEAFVEKMNEAAKDLGMTDTTYTDPSGLNNTTVSTAVDQVKLAKAAMQQPAFREVAAMMSYDDYKGKNWSNWNHLVGSNGVVGIKTGTTTSALGNLVFAAKKEVDGETRLIIGAVVRQPAGGKENTILSAALTSSDLLIRAAQGALESATILKKGTVVGYVDDGLGGRTPVAVTEDVEAVGWAGLSVKLTFAPDDDLPHQAEAGTKVGTLTVGDGTSSAVKVPVALQEDLVEPGFTDKLTRVS